MTRHSMILIAAAVALAAGLRAQSNPLTTDTKKLFAVVKDDITRSAAKMPEANYSFRPTPEVRTFGQIVAHVADSQYEFCGPARGETKNLNIEKTKTSKADIAAALKVAFAYCDATLASLTDTTGAATVNLFGGKWTKLGVLNFNTSHAFEHYGNLVTYMRMKGLVPPSSEGQ